MSYSVEWITPIFDRTYGDVITAEGQRDLVNPKGCYNYTDLNRIENNTKYVMEDMLARKIIRVPPALAIKLNWVETDIPTKDDMSRIIKNVQMLMSLSNPEITDTFDIIYESTQFTYSLANSIEHNLQIMKDQPELPIKKWLLKLEHGIIMEYNASTAYIAEDEIVNIVAQPYGENAIYMTFTNWSGKPDDLQYVGNVNESSTTFKMVYHDDENYEVELTANFITRIPRTLTLHGGIIYDDIGGTTRQFYAGDEILLLADDAATGKVFYKWQGTQEGLDNLTGGEEPSTSWLVMPDCNVDLTSFYVNAGKHKVTVDGTIQGWYDYDEYVSIYPSSRGDKYTFAYWSGDTGYLEDVTSTSFRMPDVNISFTSNWTYNYSYNTVNVINGTIDGSTKGENLREGSGHTIVANPATNGKVFSHWSLEGVGSFGNINSSSTTFYVGDGNAIITANYVDGYTVTIVNIDNTGNSKVATVKAGDTYVISTQEVVGSKICEEFEYNGRRIAGPYRTIQPTADSVYTAIYRDRDYYKLTVNNGSGSGSYMELSTVNIRANDPPAGKQFSRWNTNNIKSIGNRYSSSTYVVTGYYDDCSVTAVYEDIPGVIYSTLNVVNGSGSGTYAEGTAIRCYPNAAPSGYEFSHWETASGSVLSYNNPVTIYMPDYDYTIIAKYKEIPYYTITLIDAHFEDGTTEKTLMRGSNPIILMNPAPEGKKFFQWEIVQGGDNTVEDPLASTTRIRYLNENVIVQATYYIPQEEILYTLTITGKDGNITTYNEPMGTQIDITADEPYDGYEFLKWTGDTQYVNDRYSEKAIVNMPSKNINLGIEYNKIGSTKTYHVLLYGGEVLTETNPDTGEETWVIEGEFEEKEIVQIRAIDIEQDWKFNGWKNDEDDGKSISAVNDLTAERTFLTVEDFPITLTRDVIERDKYSLSVVNGEISGSYHESDPVNVYFGLENTDSIHYTFTRWSGNDLAYIKLFNGGSFDIYKPGTADYPQVIKIPTRNITITGNYTTTYKLSINGIEYGYYSEGEKIKISAEEIEGKRFTYWTGDISYVDNQYNPNITVTMPKGAINIIPNYHNINDNNYIGYSLTNLSNNDTINIEDITIISGEVSVGFLITDDDGHIYIVTEVVDNTAKIIRLTTIQGGDDNGQ